MAKGSKNHTHQYHKIQINGVNVWACARPDCTHYMPKHLEMMVPGKQSVCWSCGEEFTLTGPLMDTDKPKCFECSPRQNKIMDLVDQLENKITTKRSIEEIVAELEQNPKH